MNSAWLRLPIMISWLQVTFWLTVNFGFWWHFVFRRKFDLSWHIPWCVIVALPTPANEDETNSLLFKELFRLMIPKVWTLLLSENLPTFSAREAFLWCNGRGENWELAIVSSAGQGTELSNSRVVVSRTSHSSKTLTGRDWLRPARKSERSARMTSLSLTRATWDLPWACYLRSHLEAFRRTFFRATYQ